MGEAPSWADVLKALAQAFKDRRMDAHVDALRRYYRGFLDRERARASHYDRHSVWAAKQEVFHEGNVFGWCILLRVPPLDGTYPLRLPGEGCGCGAGPDPRFTRYTLRVWPGGHLWACRACEGVFVTLNELELARLKLPSESGYGG
jgi:hypothetical protein